MVYRVELAARAVRDLSALYRRIRAADAGQARRWFEGLERAILSLDEAPGRCPCARDDPSLRRLLYGSGRDSYRVLFKIDENNSVVSVLHIRHGARAPLERGDVGD